MNLFIDCEFNSFKGDLISMALVSPAGQEFYEVLPCGKPHPWVVEHVLPFLEKEPIRMQVFQHRLEKFLCQFPRAHIIASWPEDLEHFCRALITGPGDQLAIPDLSMEIFRVSAGSAVPHNALHDARGIMQAWEERQRG